MTASRRRSTRTRNAAPRRRSRRPRVWRHVLGGDRVFLLALVVVVTAVGAMALGPLQSYTAAADRVDALEETRDRLREEVDVLEDRRARLEDPEELELLARSELGLVKPGEIPFVVVVPDGDGEQVRPPATADERAQPWYRRLGRAVAELFDSGS